MSHDTVITVFWAVAAIQFAMIGAALVRASIVLGRMPSRREDVLELRKRAKSKWDPLGEAGIDRMRWVSYGLFLILVIVMFWPEK